MNMPGSLKTWDQSWDPQEGKTSEDQARRMFAGIKEQAKTGKVGIVYSANNIQAESLNTQNNSGKSPPYDANTIQGSQQAAVFKELIELIKNDQELSAEQKKNIRILPIATSMHGGSDCKDNGEPDPNNTVTQESLERDLKNIQAHVDDGWQVVAPPRLDKNLKRPDNPQPGNQFGIGGGNSKAFMKSKNDANWPNQDQTRNEFIQQGLNAIQNPTLKKQQQPPTKHTNITLDPTDKSPKSSSHLDRIIKDYNENYAKKHKLPEAKEVEGKISLNFNSDEDAVTFLKNQAEKGHSFIVKNAKGEVLGFSKDNQFFNANGTPSNGKDFGKPMSPEDFQKQQQEPASVPLSAGANTTTNPGETIKDNLSAFRDAAPALDKAKLAAPDPNENAGEPNKQPAPGSS
jgi:hypothetical protein